MSFRTEEHERARWVAARMRDIGLTDVTLDSAPNVTARRLAALH